MTKTSLYMPKAEREKSMVDSGDLGNKDNIALEEMELIYGLKNQTVNLIAEVVEQSNLKSGVILVVGCSTS